MPQAIFYLLKGDYITTTKALFVIYLEHCPCSTVGQKSLMRIIVIRMQVYIYIYIHLRRAPNIDCSWARPCLPSDSQTYKLQTPSWEAFLT